MDWIEQLLHVSPDGGSGALELIYLALVAFVIVALARRQVLHRRDRASGPDPADKP
jgi:hypothetical protein